MSTPTASSSSIITQPIQSSKKRITTSTLSPGFHKYPSFYACYLLRSYQNGKIGQRTYVGSTPDPPRRFRQHNGQLKGGASRTKNFRPWEMELICYGFPSKLVALQFEWVWNTPYKSRHLQKDLKPHPTVSQAQEEVVPLSSQLKTVSRNQAKPISNQAKPVKTKGPIFPKSLGSRLEVKLRVLKKMLTTLPWSQFPLRVLFFEESAYQLWFEQDKYLFNPIKSVEGSVNPSPIAQIDVSLRVEGVDGARKVRRGLSSDPRDQIKPLDVHDDDAILEDYEKMEEIIRRCNGTLRCHLCHDEMKIEDALSYINCSATTCYTSTHLICLARHFLASDITPCLTQQSSGKDAMPRQRILPDRGQCPKCSTNLRWGDLIKGCYRRHNINNKQPTTNDIESDLDHATRSHSEDGHYHDEMDASEDESEGEDEIAALADRPLNSGVRFSSSTARHGQGNVPASTQARSKKVQPSTNKSITTFKSLPQSRPNFNNPSDPKIKEITTDLKKFTISDDDDDEDERLEKVL
ncbi:hypothetical protein CROQUDRAFT_671248 [Cronartium quercuum f. sp. fusiforme G11]|uniref:GIY-YIG domain-containing protein n=1 Tax=Cronartium quercuum f. sp. fusiforme G11 TaxID=708437 RepID=A0A9P6NG35_9BASI|nr:hypothetical protein CROQUDRAFT_671248 [Cronartium quercuum f. sp. fusiforme G11]